MLIQRSIEVAEWARRRVEDDDDEDDDANDEDALCWSLPTVSCRPAFARAT